jgi:hypothetical protein
MRNDVSSAVTAAAVSSVFGTLPVNFVSSEPP